MGNAEGSGSPPANEMMSGRRVSFRSSRMTDRVMFLALVENIPWRSLTMSPPSFLTLAPHDQSQLPGALAKPRA